jgi:hypothetical protein
MRRREFIAGLGGATAWSIAASVRGAEQTRRVGVLMNFTAADAEYQSRLAVFVQSTP